jgi:hypothetical protein
LNEKVDGNNVNSSSKILTSNPGKGGDGGNDSQLRADFEAFVAKM